MPRQSYHLVDGFAEPQLGTIVAGSAFTSPEDYEKVAAIGRMANLSVKQLLSIVVRQEVAKRIDEFNKLTPAEIASIPKSLTRGEDEFEEDSDEEKLAKAQEKAERKRAAEEKKRAAEEKRAADLEAKRAKLLKAMQEKSSKG